MNPLRFSGIFSLLFITMNATAQLPAITSGVFHCDSLPVKKDELRESRKIAEGTTAEFEYFEIHATTQMKGAVPRPPHTQKDIEEVIIIKEGKIKCTIGDKISVLGAGSVLLIPPLEPQAVENVGDGPLTYYVFQFRSRKPMNRDRSNKAGGSLIIDADTIKYTEKDGKGTKKYFDRPTAMCDNYEMHVTSLKQKGPSHAAHQHVDTEIILITEGEMQINVEGTVYNGSAGDLFIAESGKTHQVINAADKPCLYFAFKWR